MVSMLGRGLLFRLSSWSKRSKTPQVFDKVRLFVIEFFVFAAPKSAARPVELQRPVTSSIGSLGCGGTAAWKSMKDQLVK